MYTSLVVTIILTAQPDASTSDSLKTTVERGLKWLVEQQKPDGHWVARADGLPTSTTAFAGLALLMEGSTLKDGKYAGQLRAAVEWMEKTEQESGLIATDNRTEVLRPHLPHAHALLFLACVYDVDDNDDRRKRLDSLLRRAVSYSSETQAANGSWLGTTNDDVVPTVTMLHALITTRKAGIAVPQGSIERATLYLMNRTPNAGGVRLGNDERLGRGIDQVYLASAGASATLVAHDCNRPSTLPQWVRHVNNSVLLPLPRQGNSFSLTAHFHTARLRYALGEHAHRELDSEAREATLMKWSAYRNATYPAIQQAQSANGSWPDNIISPTYLTAVYLIILQFENDYVSAFAR